MKKVIWVMLGLLTLVAAGCGRQARTDLLSTGRIVYIEGNVSVDGQPGVEGLPVAAGMTIETEGDSYCEIVFAEKNVFRIGAETIVVIAPDAGADIQIKRGTLAAVFGKLNGNRGDRFYVRSESAVLGVRGTEFFVNVLSDNNTYVCICNGRLGIRQKGLLTELESKHHKARYFKKAGGKPVVEEAPLLYHDDELMESVASRVGINLYWY
jgi:hypothetical protein